MSLKKIIYFCIFFISNYQYTAYTFRIMIDPIGDAKHTGREIEDTFERVLTLQCAQKLKEVISYNFPEIQVLLTRSAGETLTPNQNSSFANRMNVNLYIALSFYEQKAIPNNVSIFFYQENAIDQFHKYDPFHFYHISQAYLINSSVTSKIAKIFLESFQDKQKNSYFLPTGAFGFPCKPLFGIKSPALYIEAGLKNKNDWHYIVPPIIEAINEILS